MDGQECPSSSHRADHFCLVFNFGDPPFAARLFKTEFFRIFFCKCGNFEAGLRAPPVFERLMVRCPSINTHSIHGDRAVRQCFPQSLKLTG